MKNIIDSFTIGGTAAGPSVPGVRLQRLIGTQIMVYPMDRKLKVPTPDGPVMAGQGDRIVLYDDGTLGVEKHG